jgi:hypothetical protein
VASTTTVKRALKALAAGRGFVSTDDTDDDPVARVVVDAERAVDRLDTAADFLTGDGEVRLRRAVDRAERRDARVLARRGQRVLATVERFRAAAAETDPPVADGPERPGDIEWPVDTNRSADDECHRPGAELRETVKRTGGQPPDR